MIDPASSKTEGYHLFLEPSGQLAENLSEVIKELAATYDGPVFSPHVTLLGRIPGADDASVLKIAKTLAATYAPFSLTLGELGTEDSYFRALYMHVTEREVMKRRHKEALAAFNMEDEQPYTPHLSILYGNYPKETKKKTMHTLEVPVGATFKVDTIGVYKTAGLPKNWKKVGEFVCSK